MTVDYSKFAPTEFLPKLGVNCPHPDDLKTGDLLFPRTREVEDQAEMESSQNLGSDWLSRMALHLENSNDKTLLVDVVSPSDRAELFENTDNTKLTAQRSLDVSAVVAELLDEQINKISLTHVDNLELNFNKTKNTFGSNNSLYASREGLHLLKKMLSSNLQLEENLWESIDNILKNPKLVKLIIKILIAAGFGDVVKQWFNRPLPPTLIGFMKDPLVQLLFDLLLSDDVRANVFIGHVGIVIRDENNVYVIEGNITSYSHYRVAIHPYYVKSEHHVDGDVLKGDVCRYLNARYDRNSHKYETTTDYELPAAQATGWVNRRAAMLEHVWHARPISDGFSTGWQDKLISTAKALHGRPYGFFDQPALGNDDRMYCSEFVYNVFKYGISQAAANILTDRLKWKYVKEYLRIEKNNKMLGFVNKILSDKEHPVSPNSDFFVLPPAILWNSSGLIYPTPHPGGKGHPYAPALPVLP